MAVQTAFEDRKSTAEALDELIKEIEAGRKAKEEAGGERTGWLGYFVLCKLTDDGIANPDTASRKVAEAFAEFPELAAEREELRELRKQVTFALLPRKTMEKVTALEDALHAATKEPSHEALADKQEFKARVQEWAVQLDAKCDHLCPPHAPKWASCSTAGNLNFNVELLDRPRAGRLRDRP